jgi:hypothetical protein
MPTSEDEWRQLPELEAQLATHRRLVALARRLESASVDTAPRQISALWMVTGGILGLALVVAGAVVPNSVLVAAGVVILAATPDAAGQPKVPVAHQYLQHVNWASSGTIDSLVTKYRLS